MSLPAKKQIWRDNTEPPKNYIWKKTSDAGVELGTYIYNGKAWVKIANGPGNAGSVSPSVINSIYASDEEGRTTTLKYSKDEEYTIGVVLQKQNGKTLATEIQV